MVRTVALTLSAVMVVVACGDCLGKGMSPQVQMACCAAGQDATVSDEAMKCCEMTQSFTDRLILTQLAPPVTALVPVVLPVAALDAAATVPEWSDLAAYEPSLLHTGSAPTYILTGSLLI